MQGQSKLNHNMNRNAEANGVSTNKPTRNAKTKLLEQKKREQIKTINA